MTIASEISRVDYIGNGAVDTYAYTFRVFDDSHLLVTIRDTSDVETTLTLTTDYTVTGVGTSGGNVVLVDADQSWLDADGDLLTGYTLTIRRVLPLTQETDIRNQGDFYPESHEDEFDKLVMVDQQQQAQIDGSFRLPETIDPGDVSTVLPIPVANRTIGWNATADALENFANAGDLVVTAYIETLLDDANASAARTTLEVTQTNLGISSFIQTLTDDTTAAAARTTLGIPPTGTCVDYFGSSEPSGWIFASGLTIGNASSGATGRANADTVDLFTLLWNSIADTELAVSTGRGASAAADYAANKTIVVPDLRGRITAGKDNMGGTTASRITNAESGIVGTTLGVAGGAQSVTLSAAQSGVPAHTHTITDPTHTHSQNSNTRTTNAGANATDGGGGTTHQINNATLTTVAASTGITGTNSNSTAAAASSHSSVQPTYILNKIIKL